MKQRIYWSEGDDETLTHFNVHDAIEAYIDNIHPEPIESIGEITMYEYVPMTPTLPGYFSPLEQVLEVLDEEYGDPDGDNCKATDAMKQAEQTFLNAVLAEYRPWACERTGKSVTVNALEWVKEHQPDWLLAPHS